MGAVCAARPLDAETATLSKKPAPQERILLWMECFGNLNLTQEQQPPKMAFPLLDASRSRRGS
jgi:hypothetical protein